MFFGTTNFPHSSTYLQQLRDQTVTHKPRPPTLPTEFPILFKVSAIQLQLAAWPRPIIIENQTKTLK